MLTSTLTNLRSTSQRIAYFDKEENILFVIANLHLSTKKEQGWTLKRLYIDTMLLFIQQKGLPTSFQEKLLVLRKDNSKH